MSLKELQLPSIASLRALAALRSAHLAGVRPARIGLGFESTGNNQKSLAEVEDLLGGPGRLSLPYSLRWLLDVLTGLGVLHRTLGFVHGEVQPEHVVLGEDGVGRLIPVVRAHWVRGEERAPERLYYLAPEKLLGDKVDIRSDVYSVGVMLWEALAGQRLIDATEVDDIIARLMGGGMPRAHAPEGEAWTEPLTDIAERAIAVDPSRRFATVAQMKEALESACSRYVASAPGMAELFQNPAGRARARVSIAPESQRATVPPLKEQPVAEARTESQKLDAAAERLARASFSALDVDEEQTTKPRAAPPPKPRKGLHQSTLLGVPPPFIESREEHQARKARESQAPPAPDEVTRVYSAEGEVTKVYSAPPPSAAPTLMVPVQAMNLTAPVGTPAPVIAPRAPPPEPQPLPPPRAAAAAQPSLSPLVSARAPQPTVAEPSFELVRPRKRRGALWLFLGAAAAAGLFAARPWLARQVAAATGALPDNAAPNNEAPPQPVGATTPPAVPSEDAGPAASAPAAVGIASTPPVPSERRPLGQRGGPAREHVVIHDSVEPNPAIPQPAAEPKPPEKKPEPAAAPVPPPAPAPKPKPVPVSDADRYGI